MLVAVGAMGWAAIAVATQRIPSPAREVRFVRDGRAHPAFEVHCHGAFYADGGWLWSQCERSSSGDAARYLSRLDVSTGVATLLGPIPVDAYGLLGVARGSGPTRAFVLGAALLSVRGFQFLFSRQLSDETRVLVPEAVELIWEWLGAKGIPG